MLIQESLSLANQSLSELREAVSEHKQGLLQIMEVLAVLNDPEKTQSFLERNEIPIAQRHVATEKLTSKAVECCEVIIDAIGCPTKRYLNLISLSELSNSEGKKRFKSVIDLANELMTEESSEKQNILKARILSEIIRVPDQTLYSLHEISIKRSELMKKEAKTKAEEILHEKLVSFEVIKIVLNAGDLNPIPFDDLKSFSYKELSSMSVIWDSLSQKDDPEVFQALCALEVVDGEIDYKMISEKLRSFLESNQIIPIKRSVIKYFGESYWEEKASQASLETLQTLRQKAYQSLSFATALFRFLPYTDSILHSERDYFIEAIEKLTKTSSGHESIRHLTDHNQSEKLFHDHLLRLRIQKLNQHIVKRKSVTLLSLTLEETSGLLMFIPGLNSDNFWKYKESLTHLGLAFEYAKKNASEKLTFDQWVLSLNINRSASDLKKYHNQYLDELKKSIKRLEELGLVSIIDDMKVIEFNSDIEKVTSRRLKRGWRKLEISKFMHEMKKNFSEKRTVKAVTTKYGYNSDDNFVSLIKVLNHTNECLSSFHEFTKFVSLIDKKVPFDRFINKNRDKIDKFVKDSFSKESTRKLILRSLLYAKEYDKFENAFIENTVKILRETISSFSNINARCEIEKPELKDLVNQINNTINHINKVFLAHNSMSHRNSIITEFKIDLPKIDQNSNHPTHKISSIKSRINFSEYKDTIDLMCDPKIGLMSILTTQFKSLSEYLKTLDGETL